jgi:hypothetical protein
MIRKGIKHKEKKKKKNLAKAQTIRAKYLIIVSQQITTPRLTLLELLWLMNHHQHPLSTDQAFTAKSSSQLHMVLRWIFVIHFANLYQLLLGANMQIMRNSVPLTSRALLSLFNLMT